MGLSNLILPVPRWPCVKMGPDLVVDGLASVTFETGGSVTLYNGTSVLGELTVTLTQDPCN